MKWLKENWTKVLLVVIVGVFAFLYFLKDDFSDEYKELKISFDASQQKLTQVQKDAEKEIAKWKDEREEERKNREKSDKEIERIQAEKKNIIRILAAERAKVKEMADDTLVIAMNNRIGEFQVKLLQMGEFSLKRPGAENSVKLFIKGEECQNLREEDAKELKENHDKIQSLEKADLGWSNEVKEKDKVIDKQKLTLEDADKAIKRLEKDFKIERWKKRGEGFLGGVLLTLIIKAFIGG